VSHCWETAEAPDPKGRTLGKVARALVAAWPTLAKWRMDDVGLFFDWSSLYQNVPDARTPAQEARFKAALASMSIWYAHALTTVFLVTRQGTAVPRAERGWPSYEEAVSRLFKDEPRGTAYCTRPPERRRLGCFWKKVVDVDGSTWRRGPPIAPSRFAEQLAEKKFTNGADAALVAELYERCLSDGFRFLPQLSFPRMRWGDGELAELAATVRELGSCPRVTLLKLTLSNMTHLDALGDALAAGALPAMRTVVLANCTKLQRLPPALARLPHLEVLVLSACFALRELPDLSAAASLRHLDVHRCQPALLEQARALAGRDGVQLILTESDIERERARAHVRTRDIGQSVRLRAPALAGWVERSVSRLARPVTR